MSGCVFRRDGANGGTGGGNYAGFFGNAYGGQITLSGLTVWPGVNDDGSGTNSPQIGLSATGSLLNISGAYIQGATTAINDDGTNTINYDNSVVTATGTTGSPTINATPNVANYQGASMTLTAATGPANDPLRILNVNSGERSFGVRVSGQNNDRFKLTSDGKVAFGPGSATQDVSINRPSAGILSVTDSGVGGSAMIRVAASTSQTSATELFSAVANAPGDVTYVAKVNGDTQNRMRVDSNGELQWGSGSATQDATLSRSAAGLLATDSVTSFDVGANALGQVQPRNHGLVGWTFDPAIAAGNLALTNGSRYLNAFFANQTVSVTKIWFYVSTAASADSAGENFVAVVDSGGNLLNSGSADSSFTTPGLSSVTIASTALTAGKFYWILVLANCSGATSQVTLRASSLNNLNLANVNLAAATKRFTGCGISKTSLADFPVTPSSNADITSQQPLWLAAS